MAIGKNFCNCPRPPGGQVVCDENQLAICRVIEGKIYSECHSLPQIRLSNKEAYNWVLERVTKTKRSARMHLSSRDKKILITGKFSNLMNGSEATFKMPKLVKFRYHTGG